MPKLAAPHEHDDDDTDDNYNMFDNDDDIALASVPRHKKLRIQEPVSVRRGKKPIIQQPIIQEPMQELGSMIGIMLAENGEIVQLLYVPCVNGILKAGAIAVYRGLDCIVERMEFDGRVMKAFALLKLVMDEDETMRLPAVKVQLKTENFLKSETFEYSKIGQHPINQAFAVFSAVKRAVGLMRIKNGSSSVTIGPSTPVIRQFCGFGLGRNSVKFDVAIPDGLRFSFTSWDSVLGHRWDVLNGTKDESLDTAMKCLKFSEQLDFGSSNIVLKIVSFSGRYSRDGNYRLVLRQNANESFKQNNLNIVS